MTASKLIAEAAQKGLVLTLEGESIRVRGPQADPEVSALIEEIRLHKAEVVQALKSPPDPTEGRIVAVEICSSILQAHIWLALDDSFNPDDDLAVYYAEELPALMGKTPEELRGIHQVKLSPFGPGSRVRQ